jgi:hypothetical protein
MSLILNRGGRFKVFSFIGKTKMRQCPVLLHYFNNAFERTISVFLSQQISISISISQISAKQAAVLVLWQNRLFM